eukprot:symbB.v1.2.035834.t1/scaffold4918.1/size32921/2
MESCSHCEPEDCVFEEWGQWFDAGGCTQIDFRQRGILVSNNECGTPCEGNKMESRSSPHSRCIVNEVDCQWTEWSSWSDCGTPNDQSTRSRTISQKNTGQGQPCIGDMKETRPCSPGPSPEDCLLSDWHEWSECSSPCGPGVYSRFRKVIQEAQHEGRSCDGVIHETDTCEVRPCDSMDCQMSEWSEWSSINPTEENAPPTDQLFRTRTVVVPPGMGGSECPGGLIETKPQIRPSQPCVVGDWSFWSECDRTCAGGQKMRERSVEPAHAWHPSRCAFEVPLTEKMYHMNASVKFLCKHPSFMKLSDAFAVLGLKLGEKDPTRIRSAYRQQLLQAHPDKGGDTEVFRQVHLAGDLLLSTRPEVLAKVKARAKGKAKAKSQGTPTPRPKPSSGHLPVKCNSKRKSDSSRLASVFQEPENLEGLFSGRTPTFSKAASCKAAAQPPSTANSEVFESQLVPSEELESRQADAAADSAVTNEASPAEMAALRWRLATLSQQERRALLVQLPASVQQALKKNLLKEKAAHSSGEAFSEDEDGCGYEVQKMIAPCGLGPCHEAGTSDCQLSEWDEWSECSSRCGTGSKSRSRSIVSESMFGGNPCEGPLKELARCEVSECNIVNCRWGDWSGWSDCSCECGGGTKRRTRHVAEAPRNGGLACEPQDKEEAFPCSTQPCVQLHTPRLGVNGLIARHHVQAAIDLAAATLKFSQALAAKLQLVTEMSSNSAQISRHVSRIQIAKSMNGASGRTAAAIALVLEKGIATSPTLLLERESHVQ